MLNKDPDIVPEETYLVILDGNSTMCIGNNGKDTKLTSHIARRIHFVINGEKCKFHRIHWCEGGLQWADISAKSFGEHDLTPMMKYIMVRLDNW